MLPLLKKLERKASSAIHKHGLVYLLRHFEERNEPVTLVMPVALKDLQQAECSIAGIRKFLLHPIEEIIVPGQSSRDVAAFCERVGARYIDEEAFLPESIKRFQYRRGKMNRNGWVRQQILKLCADDMVHTQKCLIFDSDTCPVRHLSFMRGHRPILFVSDEYNSTYHDCVDRLLGPMRRYPRSFIAHCMLFDREVLWRIKHDIARHCQMAWIDAILDKLDTSVEESFSEYELYGTYVYNKAGDQFQTEYWYNRKLCSGELIEIDTIPKHFRRQNFLSNHVHLRNVRPECAPANDPP